MNDEYVACYQSAVLPVQRWLTTSNWVSTYIGFIDEYYEGASEIMETSATDAFRNLPGPLWLKAAQCAFEDLLIAAFDSDTEFVLDEYLKEVGDDLHRADVDYLAAFRMSVVRLYFVVERTPGVSVVLRNVSDGTRSIQIEDDAYTEILRAGDTVATRILMIDGRDYLGGQILVLDRDSVSAFNEIFDLTFKDEMRKVEKYLQKDIRTRNSVRQRLFEAAGPLIAGMWGMSAVAALMAEPPLIGEDDPSTVFEAMVAFQGEFLDVVQLLDEHPELARPLPSEYVWVWHRGGAEAGASLKAWLWMDGDGITLESCEMSRLDEAIQTLRELLGDAILDVSIEQVDGFDYDDLGDEEDEDDLFELPFPEAGEDDSRYEARIHAALRAHLSALLDMPTPDLNDKTPHEMLEADEDRSELVAWLTTIETSFTEILSQEGFKGFDFAFLWEELGISDLRQG